MGGLNGDLEGVIENLKRLHWEAENRVSEAQAILDQAKAGRDHINRVLKAAGAIEEKPEPKRKTKPGRVNEETRNTVLRAIRNWVAGGWAVIPDVPHSFTAGKIRELAADVHESSVRTAIGNLRDEGIIRAVGLVPNSPRKAPMAYVLGEGNEASE
jgi:hypothetical protein